MRAVSDRLSWGFVSLFALVRVLVVLSRRYVHGLIAGLGLLTAVLLSMAAPALAAAPETPGKEPATAITATTATLHGELNPKNAGEPGTYEFRYRPSATECEGEQEKQAPEPRGTAAGVKEEHVSTPVAGLLPATTYTFCLRAENGAGGSAVGPPETFTTPAAAPTITAEQASNVASTTATVSAQIDPGGEPTTYHVEYVTDAQLKAEGFAKPTGVPVPDANLAAATSPVTVSQNLTGLQPGATYHFRFAATNSLGTIPGEDTILHTSAPVATGGATETACSNATYSGFKATLPDCRAYELVSPAGNTTEPFTPEVYSPRAAGLGHQGDFTTAYPFRAAAGGQAVAYVGEEPSTTGTGATGSGQGNQWFASRATGGWSATDIAPPVGAGETATETSGGIYRGFSKELTTGVLEAASRSLAARAEPMGAPGCAVLYTHGGIDARFSALFSESRVPSECGQPVFAGGNEGTATVAPYSHLLFQTAAALTSDAVKANGSGEEDLYESYAGQLRSVNVLPGNVPDPNATFGGQGSSATHPNFTNVISEDGSRIFWTDLNTKDVYVRQDGTRTVKVSTGPATYLTATPNGEYAFYLEGGALWRFDTHTEGRERLAGTGSVVQGVVGTSADGHYVYFVSGEGLASGAPTASCVEATTGQAAKEEEHGKLPPGLGCNLYVFHDGSPVRLVATVAPKDGNLHAAVGAGGAGLGSGGLWALSQGSRTGEVSPDGRHLVFESSQQLTGYDNSGLEEENNDRGLEVFVYSAEEGRLACASCDPRGLPPTPEGQAGGSTYLPVSANDTYMRRWMSEDGSRVFFDTSQPLVSQDTNGLQDVYQWEREGTRVSEGSTASSCPVQTSPRRDRGCVSLLSGGDRPDFSYFVDASATGGDVFFTSIDRFVPRDRDEEASLYDARVGGGLPETSLACAGTGCQGVPPAAPIFATPSSVTFNGVGNFPAPAVVRPKALTNAQKLAAALRACAKKPKKQRAGCQKQARKRYAVKSKSKRKARKTTTNRRASK